MTVSAPPLVSVVIAVYDGAALIGETLESLARQSFTDFEIIVVDDGSTDATPELLRAWPDPRLRVLRASVNGGCVTARNLGFAAARGRYIAALDHDDLCRPDRLAHQVTYLERQPETVLVGTNAVLIEDGIERRGGWTPITTPDLIEWLLLIENPLVWSSVMFRADAARRLDPVTRPDYVHAEDFDFYHRLAPFGRIARLDVPLVAYRIVPTSLSRRNTSDMHAKATRVLATRYNGMIDAAEEAAELVVAHVMCRRSVPDRATLARLGAILGVLQTAFLRERQPDRDNHRLIRWETARRWGAIGRAALRSGAIGLPDLLSVRPDHLGLGYAGVEALAVSGLIGGLRAIKERFAPIR